MMQRSGMEGLYGGRHHTVASGSDLLPTTQQNATDAAGSTPEMRLNFTFLGVVRGGQIFEI